MLELELETDVFGHLTRFTRSHASHRRFMDHCFVG